MSPMTSRLEDEDVLARSKLRANVYLSGSIQREPLKACTVHIESHASNAGYFANSG